MFDDTMIAKFVSSPNEFTIELTEEVAKVLGWSNKNDAVSKMKQELIEAIDYSSELLKNAQRGRPSHLYLLSYNGLKLLASTAPGDKGKAYRRHLVEVENRYYQLVAVAKETVTKALPPMWKENRLLLSDVEPSYQRWCRAASFNASFVTNYIYVAVCNGDDAAALRLKETIDGSPSIAANHISQPELVEEVARIKNRLTKYTRKFSYYKDAVNQAIGDLEHARK